MDNNVVFHDERYPQTWSYGEFGPDGECYVVNFSGIDAELRARAYYDWRNSEAG